MLRWRYLNVNYTNVQNTLFAKKIAASLLNFRLESGRNDDHPRFVVEVE